MYKIGLKLWSMNTDYYYKEAIKLYKDKFFDYIELYVVPGTINTLNKWKQLNIPINIHCPHFLHGFNLADHNKQESNLNIYKQVKEFADKLDSEYIVFHCGMGGTIEETAEQLKMLKEPRGLIENKPCKVLIDETCIDACRGADIDEVKYVLYKVGCGFCLDFGHAVCAANSLKIDPYDYINEFMKLNPSVYHLMDVKDIKSEYDAHLNLGRGSLDIKRLLKRVPQKAKITIETEKNFKDNLRDFIEDVNLLKNLANSG